MSASGPEATSAAASAALFTTAARAQALATADATRTLDNDALRFIDQQIVGNTHQEILYKGWAEVHFTDGKFKPRLIVVSTFRLYILKPGPLGGLGIRQSFLLAHLRTAAPGSLAGAPDLMQMALTFDDDSADQREFNLPGANFGTINIAHKCVDTILQAILFSAEAIRTGRPPITTKALPIPWLDGYRPPNPDDQDGLLAAYLAECDRVGIPQRIGVLDYFMTCFQLKDTMMDLRAVLGFLDGRDCAKDVLALVSALKYSTLFTTFVCVDLVLRNDGAAALATMFNVPTVFTKLVLVNCRISRPAMASLGAALAKGPQPIDHLIISRSDIGDAGILALCEGLGAAANNRPIASICLSAVDMGPKGLRALSKLLRQPHWLSSVRALDLTDNPLGKSGTDVLAAAGEDSDQGLLRLRGLMLEQLTLRRCDLDVERLLAALIAAETKLPHTTLSLLDISGNRVTKKSVAPLAQFVTSSRFLSCLSLSACRLEPSGVAALLVAAMDNRFGVSFSFDFSCNELGTKGIREIIQALADKAAKSGLSVSSPAQNVPALPLPQSLDCIQYLDLSETQMNAEALSALVPLLAPFALDSLRLDRCFKPSLFAKPQDAGTALATILNSLPSLTELSVAGDTDTYYLGRALLPLLAAVAKHEKLAYIDFHDNRAGDEGLAAFASAAIPGSALRGASLDGSRAGLTGFHALLGVVQLNRRLVHLTVPEQDLSRLLRTLPPSRAGEVQVIIHALDVALDRNENNLSPESAILENDDEDDTASETSSVSSTSVNSGPTPPTTSTTGPPPFPGAGSYSLAVPGSSLSRPPSRSPMSSRPSSAGPPSLPGSSPRPPVAPVVPPTPTGPPAFIPPTPANRSATPPVKHFMPAPPTLAPPRTTQSSAQVPAPPRAVRSKRMSVITQGLDLGPVSAPSAAPAATGPPPPGGIALALPSLLSASATSAAAARAAANAPRGSLFGSITAPPAATAATASAVSPRGAQRMSVAAGSYSDMMIGLKSAKALRKMTTRHFDASVHALAAAAAAGMTVEAFHGGNDSAPTPAVSPSAPSSPAAQSVAAAIARKAAQGPMRPTTPSVSGTRIGAVAVATEDDTNNQALRIQYAVAPSTGAGGSSRGSFAGPAGASTPVAVGSFNDSDAPKHRRVATAAAGLRPMAPPVPQAPSSSPPQDSSDPRHRRVPTAGPGLQSAGFAAAAAAVAAAMKRRNEQDAASPTGARPKGVPLGGKSVFRPKE